MKKLLLFCLLFLFANKSSFSQSISLFDIDQSSYPNIVGKFYSYDKNGYQIKHQKSELSIFENGANRSIVRVDCPPGPPQKSLSSVLVMDVSLSMNVFNGSATNLELAQAAALSWIDALGTNNECAITSFSDYNYSNQDFTTDKSLLIKAVNQLKLIGGTDYDMALLNPAAGGLKISMSGKYQRVIVFLTDGVPNRDPKVDEIVTQAKLQNCVIYCVTLGMKAPRSLIDIATRTGGKVFENVTTIDEAKGVYQKILDISQGSNPCIIEWVTQPDCSIDSTLISLKVNSTNIETQAKVKYGKSVNPQILFVPAKLSFTDAVIGQPVTKTLNIKATLGDLTVTNITSTDSKFSISPKNFSIKKGDSISLTVSYRAIDDGYHFAKFTFQSNSCPLEYYISGKLNRKKLAQKTLKLTFPNGGETFVVGTDSIITWTGIAPNELVRLEYSFDNGNSWNFIDTASGLSYKWKRIPMPTSTKCLVRVIQLSSTSPNNSFNIVEKDPIVYTNTMPFSKDGKYILYFTFDKSKTTKAYKANVFNIKNKTVDYSFYIDTIPGYGTGGGTQATIGNFVSFSPKGDYIAIGYGQRTEIWNYRVNQLSPWPVITRPSTASNRNGYLTSLSFNATGDLLVRGEAPNNTSTLPKAYVWDISNLQSVSLLLSIPFSPAAHDLIGHTIFHPVVANVLSIAGLYGWKDYTKTPSGLCGIDMYTLNTGGTNSATLNTRIAKDTLANTIQGYSVVGPITYNSNGNFLLFKDQSFSKLMPPDFTDTIKIWSKLTSKVEKSSMEHKGADNISMSPDDYYLATSSFWDSTVKLWDFADQSIVKEIKHNSKVSSIQYSKDGQYIAIHGWDNGVITFWSIDEVGLQEDISDAVFRIVAPSAAASDINMGNVLISRYKDSVITRFVRNTGTWNVRVDSLYFRGPDASSFKLISGFPKYDINIGGNKSAEFSFTPRRVGPHSADIVVMTQSDTLIHTIIGNGVQQSIGIGSTLIDFGQVELKKNKDTLNVGTIKNIGPTQIIIDSTKHSLPNDVDFTTLSGGGSFALAPGEERKLNLRFTPSSLGRTSGTLNFYYKGPGSPATVQLFGEGINKSPSILTSIQNFKTLSCEKTDTVNVTITNGGAAPLEVSNVTISGINSSEFTYLGNTSFSLLPDSTVQFKVIFSPTTNGDKTADLIIYSNAVADSVRRITLQGRKDAVSLKSIIELDLGVLCPFEEKAFTVGVQNAGSSTTTFTIISDSNIALTSSRDTVLFGMQKNVQLKLMGIPVEGVFNRTIKIVDICGNTLPVKIRGRIVKPYIESSDLVLSSLIGNQTEGIVKIKNFSLRDVTITSISGISAPFKIISPTVPFNLPVSTIQDIVISYTPSDSIIRNQQVLLSADPCSLIDTFEITGIPSNSRATVMVGNYSGYPGEVIDIPIELTDTKNINVSGITSLSMDLAFNPSLISPRGHSITFIDDTLATISIKNLSIPVNDSGKLITLTCDIGLGNAEKSELSLLNVKENTGIVPLTIKDGTFNLLGICYEGGTRLVSTSKKTALLSINPNPSDGQINLSINMLEKGKHTIRILDSRGFLIDESEHDLQNGTLKLQYDAYLLNTGVYFIQLLAPTQTVVERLIIHK